MQKQTSVGLLKMLGHVTLLMWIPMLGGGVAGMVLDSIAGTSPLLAAGGLLLGTLVSAAGIWWYIRHRQPGAEG